MCRSSSPCARERRRWKGPLVSEDVSLTLATGNGQVLILLTSTSVRRLTPTECERLQGFPDGWTAVNIKRTRPVTDKWATPCASRRRMDHTTSRSGVRRMKTLLASLLLLVVAVSRSTSLHSRRCTCEVRLQSDATGPRRDRRRDKAKTSMDGRAPGRVALVGLALVGPELEPAFI